jgi:hypothetical protein
MPTKHRKITTVLIRCRYAAIRCASLLAVAPGLSMHSIKKIFFALVWFTSFGLSAASAQSILGARGAESDPNRRQQWLVPSPDPATPAHAVLFRPNGDGPFPLAVIAHATTQNVLRRAQMPQPEYRALAAFLVARGFAVLVPERLGHGGTGGRYQEDQGGCDDADYSRAGRATADQIAAAMNFLPAALHPAGSHACCRPLRGRLGRPGARPGRARGVGHRRLCAGTRRPRQ